MSTCPATLTVKITDAAGRTTVPYALLTCRLEQPHDAHAGNHPGDGSLIAWTAGPLVAVVETADPAPVKRGPGRPRKPAPPARPDPLPNPVDKP